MREPAIPNKHLKTVDELCVCGRLQSCHPVADLRNNPGCQKFAWVAFKLEDGTFWPDPSPIVPR